MREKRHAARRAARTAVSSRFVVLTGLSGSGKSQAIRALGDLGYFGVDNLPVTLLPMLAELTLRAGTEISRAAVVVDVREGKMLKEFPPVYRRLEARKNLRPEMTVHELRHVFTGVAAGSTPGSQLVVTILSFGFKHGIPVDSDLLFDVRFLPNPHFVPDLRPHTGRDPEVVKYLEKSESTHEFLTHTLSLLNFLVPQYVNEGKSYLTIGI